MYILNESGEPVPEPDASKWSQWFENADRIVQQDTIGDVGVATVFPGADHNYFGDGPPLLWETMIFGGDHDGYRDRYASRAAALAGHDQALAMAKESKR
jgi:hypothetical protein